MRSITERGCSAPDEVFTPRWDDIPEELKLIIIAQGSLGCEGGGVPGHWCRGCHWEEKSEYIERD